MRMLDRGFIDACISYYNDTRSKTAETMEVVEFLYSLREGRNKGHTEDFYKLFQSKKPSKQIHPYNQLDNNPELRANFCSLILYTHQNRVWENKYDGGEIKSKDLKIETKDDLESVIQFALQDVIGLSSEQTSDEMLAELLVNQLPKN